MNLHNYNWILKFFKEGKCIQCMLTLEKSNLKNSKIQWCLVMNLNLKNCRKEKLFLLILLDLNNHRIKNNLSNNKILIKKFIKYVILIILKISLISFLLIVKYRILAREYLIKAWLNIIFLIDSNRWKNIRLNFLMHLSYWFIAWCSYHQIIALSIMFSFKFFVLELHLYLWWN